MSDDALDLILGGGGKGCSFNERGATHEGVVVRSGTRQARVFGSTALKTWDNGDPVIESYFTMQTAERDPEVEHDDGLRTLYADSKGKKTALRDAFQAAGVKRGDSIEGGTLKIQYVADEPGQGAQPKKVYRAKFTPPVASAPAEVWDDAPYPDDSF